MTMKKTTIFLALLAFAFSSCAKANQDIPEWPWYDESDPDLWEETNSYGKLPEYIRIYKSAEGSRMKGRRCIAYIAKVDATKASFNVWGLDAVYPTSTTDPFQTPTDVYNKVGAPSIVINGGYFFAQDGVNYVSSLAVNNGVMTSVNWPEAAIDWTKAVYSPTRGAFIEHSDGRYEVAWTYYDSTTEAHYVYHIPAPNSYSSDPKPTPSAEYPCQADPFEAKNAIGAGPVLIKDGKIINSWDNELFLTDTDVMVNVPAPRTAIGITKDKHLVLFVCEGRDMTPGIAGYTTAEVAKILLSFGCVDALNLDGGGSTCMLINGMETVKPSDGDERPVGNCVYIK